MGSKLTRQRSLDLESKLSKRRRQRNDSPGEGDTSVTGRGGRDFLFTSLMLRSDKLPGMLRKSNLSPYVRRVAWIREIQRLLREHKTEQAAEVLKLLRKDLGLQGSSLSDILYKNAAFLNLVDPISHELLLSLARDLQCPKKKTESLKSTNKICRQLIYHLTPHSKWTRQNVPRRKSQACLKTTLKKKLSNDIVNLAGIPLSGRDIHRVAFHLQSSSDAVSAVDLSFTELQDESLRLLLPFLSCLPKLTVLAVNGNRLTVAILKDLTDAIKDPKKFPSLAWVDLGNNVDIFTVPQPLLVALRRRFGLRSSLPTIYEYNEARALGGYNPSMETSVEEPSLYEEAELDGGEGDEEEEDRLELQTWGLGEESYCGR
ncbi:leucine-rich repeat-containing protein 75B-like isoform X1 [Thalassophryne amazonica]|uniref:leucine-rich repeat-containing protein 75B-like isoform X1 n=1 Tax=Thalassophryne amazonica TaxID=390379 RepID=UPI001470AF35|nr:leucine-rich repeat-containing protein 75B-like isoform X1 [Thalassophryne amazonica]